MGMLLGPCKKCGKMMMRPHPSGLCEMCRKKISSRVSPDIPDVPEPLKYRE
ncbi:MAG: hypothetical protein ACFFAJ_10395 [Candidatus Hodarchaeota archaeon]